MSQIGKLNIWEKKQQRKKKEKKGKSKIKRPPNRLTYSELLSKDGPLAQG